MDTDTPDDPAAALRHLLDTQPVAALATLHRGAPAVSMVPFARLPGTGRFVIHVSRLATHTADMLADPRVSLLVMAPPAAAGTPLALPRASLQGLAQACAAEAPEHAAARAAYLARLPEAEELFSFDDFSLFVIDAQAVRFVRGFGRALSLVGEGLAAAWQAPA